MNTEFIKNKITQHSSQDESVGGDFNLNPEMIRKTSNLVPAAVLIPLVLRKSGITLLFTRRTEALTNHPGQISFPGGHVDSKDNSPIEAALRETKEEVGIGEKHINIIGTLDVYETRTGFSVLPIVGFIYPPFDIRPDPREVAEVFEVPLSFLMDSRNHEQHTRQIKGNDRKFHAILFGSYFIWGATAGMILNLYNILNAD